MSETQVHGQLTQVDENGNVTVMLPHTTTDDITGVLPISKGGTGVTTREQFFSDTLNDTFGITNLDDLYEKISTHTISKDDLDGGYANLDDYKSPGVYYFRVGTVETSKHPECIVEELMNPDDSTPPGYLYIMSNDTRTHLSQFWITTNSKAIYRRNWEAGIWRDWEYFIDFPEIENGTTKIYFGECTSETGESNEIKNVTTTNGDFTLEKDSVVIIEFTSNNVAESPKINIDNTGEKDIYYKGVISASEYFALNDYHTALKRGTYIFVYSHRIGDQYELTGYINNVTTMTGATETDNGVAGLVPRPEAGDQSKFLRGDGEWVDVIGATGELIASPNVGSASGTLKIEHGGTGATTAGVGLYNLSFHAPTESGINLDSLINNDDMGYWYFGSNYLPTNAPVENIAGYLFVIRGGSNLRKQIWMNQGVRSNHQDIYVRTRGSNEWQPWIKIKNSRIALVGSDIRGETGWHKVASGSLTGYSNTSLIFAVHDTKSYSSGILVVDIRSSNGVLTCGKFGWLVSDNINFDDYILNITDDTWTMYYNVQQQYYRNVFEVIEESGTNTLNAFYLLYSNQNKEATTPTATVTSSAIGYAATAGNASTVNNLTVKTAVPENAVFTDTTYSNMTGATSSAAGTSGLVPAPAAGKQASFLRGDGTWVVPTNTTYSNATTSTAGLMSATDKSKLDGIATGANKTTVDSSMSPTSTNPVQNKVIYSSLIEKAPLEHEHPFTFIEGDNVTIESNNNKARIVCIGDDNTLDLSDGTNVSYLPAIVLGRNNTVKGPNGIVVGPGNTVKDASTYVFGYGNTMNDNSIWSFATGYGNRHRGDLGPSFMCGLYGTIGSGSGTMYYTPSYNGNNYALLEHPDAQAFVIGNGYFNNGSPSYSNAFRVNYSGAVYAMTYNTSGADYAEFIKPWADGNPDKEDRVGFMVTIKNGYLEKANDGDYIIGITSGNPAVIGNGDEDFYWKYERDKFNRIIYEPVTEKFETGQLDENGEPIYKIQETFKPKLSNDYDPELQDSYVERRYRPEWSYVGMRGIVPVRDDGSCEAGGFCKCGVNGVATKSERGLDTYYVIERIDDNIISVEVK